MSSRGSHPGSFAARIERFKVRLVIRALRKADGHVGRAAALIGMHSEALRHWIKRNGMQAHVKDYRAIGHPGRRGPRGPQKHPRVKRVGRYTNRGNAAWQELGA